MGHCNDNPSSPSELRWANYGDSALSFFSSPALGAIAESDPNDTATYEAIRQGGLDLIAKMANPAARQAAEAAWRSNTAKARAGTAERLGDGNARR